MTLDEARAVAGGALSPPAITQQALLVVCLAILDRLDTPSAAAPTVSEPASPSTGPVVAGGGRSPKPATSRRKRKRVSAHTEE